MNRPLSFKFHKNCKCVNLNHLCFADNLFLFSYGDVKFVRFFTGALQYFQNVQGLQINKDKSFIFFANIDKEVKVQILQALSCNLPVKYLGLPLVSTAIKKVHCQKLADRIVAKMQCWYTKHLSYVGRAQLINVVLRSMSVY